MNKEKTAKTKQRVFSEQGERLKKCLKYAGMKQSELAERTIYPAQYINNMVNGFRKISSDRADILAPVLGVRREYLLLKDDFMTVEDMISDVIGKRTGIDAASFGLLDALGYRFEGTTLQPDGSRASMHRPYSRVTINKQIDECSHEDTDAEILEKVHSAPPVRYYVVTAPDGERFQVEQEDFVRIIDDISDFARFRIQQARQHYFRHR